MQSLNQDIMSFLTEKEPKDPKMTYFENDSELLFLNTVIKILVYAS